MLMSEPSDGNWVADRFPIAWAYSEQSAYFGLGGGIGLDTRNNRALSTRGGLVKLEGGYNDARVAGISNYWHYSLELQSYLNIKHNDRTLCLRAYGAGMDAEDLLPYQELERPGGERGMRGYARHRFADRTQLVLTAEYRYRISSKLLGGLFIDWGSVARRWEDMRLANNSPSAGLILGFLGNNPLAVQAAVSKEGWQFYLGIASLFRERTRRLQ
jgi:outer membrane protein assembly factor BamA